MQRKMLPMQGPYCRSMCMCTRPVRCCYCLKPPLLPQPDGIHELLHVHLAGCILLLCVLIQIADWLQVWVQMMWAWPMRCTLLCWATCMPQPR